jgi:putative transposase
MLNLNFLGGINMRDQKKAEAIATQRLELLSPLLAEGLDPAKASQIKAQICAQTGISERTLRRHLAQYREEGFLGLRPKGKGYLKNKEAIPPEILEQAIVLRREVPSRSVVQIIQILEWERLSEPGQIKRSTLQEKLTQRGYSTRHMRMYNSSGVAARRFQQKHRNQLWHSDLKYGPYLPIGINGTKKQVYLVIFLDDATRFILHGQFYPTLDQIIVEDCFRQAVQKYGVPDSAFFDNGTQYRTKWMARACAKMGIRLLYARPYSPESTGKIERVNRVVDAFLNEAALVKPKTLDELNKLFWVWLEECYQNKPHSALEGQKSPEAAYRSDSKALKFLDPEIITNAFLHYEERKVDKAGCISFEGKKYEVGLQFIGCKVDVIFDPADTSQLTIEYEGHQPWTAKRLVIGEKTGKRPDLPPHLQPQPAQSSRLLAAAAKQNEQRKAVQTPAVTYRTVKKDGEGND